MKPTMRLTFGVASKRGNNLTGVDVIFKQVAGSGLRVAAESVKANKKRARMM